MVTPSSGKKTFCGLEIGTSIPAAWIITCSAIPIRMTDTGAVSPSIPGVPTTVLVAPDSFKGTFTAAQVARAIGQGLEAAGRPVDLCPVADGGEGTLQALARPWP